MLKLNGIYTNRVTYLEHDATRVQDWCKVNAHGKWQIVPWQCAILFKDNETKQKFLIWQNTLPQVVEVAENELLKLAESCSVVYTPAVEKLILKVITQCRDMFVVGSVSWNLLNEKLEHVGVE